MRATLTPRRGLDQKTPNASDVSCATVGPLYCWPDLPTRSSLICSMRDPRGRTRQALQEGRGERRRRHLLPGEGRRVLRVARPERGGKDDHDLDPDDHAVP